MVYDQGELVLDDTGATVTEYYHDALGRTRSERRGPPRPHKAPPGSPRKPANDNHGRVVAESDAYKEKREPERVLARRTDQSFVNIVQEDPLIRTIIPTKCYAYDAAGRLASVTLPKVPDPDNGGALDHPVYVLQIRRLRKPNPNPRPERPRDVVHLRRPREPEDADVAAWDFGTNGFRDADEDATPADGAFTEEFDYDDRGRQTKHVSFEGRVTVFVYDDTPGAGGRLSEKLYFANEGDYDNWAIDAAE